jgi:DNA processing protein
MTQPTASGGATAPATTAPATTAPVTTAPATVHTGDDGDRLFRIALAHLVEPGDRELGALVRHHGASATLDLALTGGLASAQLTEAAAARLTATGGGRTRTAALAMAGAAIAAAQRLGVRIITTEDEEWPVQVDQVPTVADNIGGLDRDGLHRDQIDRDRFDRGGNPPLCLWVRGTGSVAETLHRSVAVVGARAATSYGEHVAAEIADGLATRDWTVVAGGAYGIETKAHRGALAAGGRIVAVLATGIDRPYPAGNTALFEQIADHGLLVSAWPLGTPPVRTRFPARTG